MPKATYAVDIDWNNDGLWTGTGEAVIARVRSSPGISSMRGRDQARSLAPPMASACTFDLDNQSKDYSPENAASPLFGTVLPGRPVRWQATFQAATFDLFRGVLQKPQQHPERLQQSVTLPCLGMLLRLVGQAGQPLRISTALFQNVRTDQCIGVILDAVSWPAADRVLDAGKSTLAWWWLDEEDPLAALIALLNSEGPGSAIYEDGKGRLHFENRHFRLTQARSTGVQSTFRDSGTEPLHSAPFFYDEGLDGVINEVVLSYRTRAAQALSVVWTAGATLTLGNNESRNLIAVTADPFTAAVTPVQGTDYTVTAGAVTSVTLSRTSGQSTKLTFTGGANGATVTNIQLRAQLVTVQNTIEVSQQIDTAASKTKYGVRPYGQIVRQEFDLFVTVQDLANAIVSIYQNPRPTLGITINNAAAARLTDALKREISDRVRVIEASSSVDVQGFVEQITHLATMAGNLHLTRFGIEKASAVNYAVWGTAIWGSSVWAF